MDSGTYTLMDTAHTHTHSHREESKCQIWVLGSALCLPSACESRSEPPVLQVSVDELSRVLKWPHSAPLTACKVGMVELCVCVCLCVANGRDPLQDGLRNTLVNTEDRERKTNEKKSRQSSINLFSRSRTFGTYKSP